MAASKGRWWEDYLVRYLTPTLVGTGLLLTLGISIGLDGKVSAFDTGLLWNSKKEANLAVIVGLLVSGFAFAYLCSTPITVFHAGRMLDKSLNRYATPFWSSWAVIASIFVIGLIVDIAFGKHLQFFDRYRAGVILLFTALPAVWLGLSQYEVIWRLKKDKGSAETSTFLRFYANLAAARGTTNWARELRESYTHLREHANSVFICFAEISVASLILLCWKLTQEPVLFAASLLLGSLLWLLPNIFLWSIANSVEKYLIGEQDVDVAALRKASKSTAAEPEDAKDGETEH